MVAKQILKAVLCVAAATLALGANTGRAEAAEFHSEVPHVVLHQTLTANLTLQLPSGHISCVGATAEGTWSLLAVTDVTLTGKIFSCKTKSIFGSIESTFDFKGCDLIYNALTRKVRLHCPTGSGPITITGPGCTITLAGQELEKATYSNTGVGTGRKINVITELTSVTSTATGAFCSSTGTSKTGTWTGSSTLAGRNTSGESVGIWYE